MNKFITIILSLLLICVPCEAFASTGSDVIYDIINRNEQSTVGSDIIYDILDKKDNTAKVEKDKMKIKIVKEDTIDNEIESENKTKDKNDYIKGLDISKWNGDIDWDSVKKAGIKFVIIRAGYGTHIDYKFEQNIKNAIKHDMIIGIYWFCYSHNNDMAIREAKICINTISKYKKHISLPVFYDLEYDSVDYARKCGYTITKQKASDMTDVWCSTIKKAGYNVGVYTNIDYANRYFTRELLNKYNTWIAQWTSACTYRYDYIIWQRTDSYYINNRKFDLNYFYYNRFEVDKK